MRSKPYSVRINPELKEEVEDILSKLGLKTSDAINMLFHQIKMKKGIPFDVHIPNAVTEETFSKTERGEDLHEYSSVQDAIKDSAKW